jgi:DNA-binding NtrC family response regulator
MRARILIIDDDPDIALPLEKRLTGMGHEALVAHNGTDGLSLIEKEQPDLVLLDLELPLVSGLEVLQRVRDAANTSQSGEAVGLEAGVTYTRPLIVIMTAFGTIERAVQAMQLGAFDFVTKPFTKDHLAVVINKALATLSLHRQVETLRKEVDRHVDPIIGANQQMSAQLARAKKAASSAVAVLVLGETGTGKEVLARAIHRWSPRCNKPFVAINCAAIPETLIEAELFGHEKGIFTGATSMRRGQFEQADSGTLFLDEIGDMSLVTQAKILRALEEQEFRRLGGTKPIKVDVRVLAATNKDLQQAIRQGTFREDLYFRLAVITITPPPLRDRKDDLPALAQHFINSRSDKLGLHRPYKLSELAVEALQQYAWPGNIRELDNVISRALILCSGDTIEPEDLLLPDPPSLSTPEPGADPQAGSYYESVDIFSKKLIENALLKSGWNQTKAAASLGLQRTYFTVLLKKFQVAGRQPPPPTLSNPAGGSRV